MIRITALFSLFSFLAACGCRTTPTPPDLGGLYNRSASYHGPDRNPIIVIPGILGSKLVDRASQRVVWGAFAGDYANPNESEGARLTALPMRQGAPLRELKDEVASAGALDRLKVEFLGLPFESEAYAYILKTLGVGGYRDESLSLAGAIDYGDDHYTCFQFDYDWRRDNVENAQRLHQFILTKRAYVQKEIEKRHGIKDKDVKFDIIAHSMGGLLTRYYLRYGDADLPDQGPLSPVTWAGRRHVDRVVLVGTPNAGSAHALQELVEGISFSSVLPHYPAAILSTFPSIFQLLPRTRHLPVVEGADPQRAIPEDLLDWRLWEKLGWGLADPREDVHLQVLLPEVKDPAERRQIALDHLRKSLERARRFFAALDSHDRDAPGAPHMHIVVGDAVPTPAVLAVDRATGKLTVAANAPGDGTVVRASTLLDERVGGEWSPTLRSPIQWGHVTFLFSDHLGLTRDPAFTDNVLYLLLEEPR